VVAVSNHDGKFNPTTNILSTSVEDQNALLNYLDATEAGNGYYNFILSDGEQAVPYINVYVDVNESEPLYNVCNAEQKKIASGMGAGMSGAKAAAEPGKAYAGKLPKSKATTEAAAGGNMAGAGAMDRKGDNKPNNGVKDGVAKGAKSTVAKAGEEGLTSGTKSESSRQGGSTSESGIAKITGSFTDKEGTKYLFYKNAKCELIMAARNNNNCTEITEYFNDKKAKQIVLKATGKYKKTIFQDFKRCVKGEGFCTEMLQIQSTNMIYDDKECKRLIKVESRKAFNCQ